MIQFKQKEAYVAPATEALVLCPGATICQGSVNNGELPPGLGEDPLFGEMGLLPSLNPFSNPFSL